MPLAARSFGQENHCGSVRVFSSGMPCCREKRQKKRDGGEQGVEEVGKRPAFAQFLPVDRHFCRDGLEKLVDRNIDHSRLNEGDGVDDQGRPP